VIYFELCLRFTILQVLRSKTFLYFFRDLKSWFYGTVCRFYLFGGYHIRTHVLSFLYSIFADTGNESTSDTVPCHFLPVYYSLQLFVTIIFPLFFFYHYCCSGHHIIVLAVLIHSLISFLNSLPSHTRIHPLCPIDSLCSCHPFLPKL
jgi:hypothetical protein